MASSDPMPSVSSSTSQPCASAICICHELTPADIPGCILNKDYEKCKKSELQFWLKCRQLKFKSTDTRAVLISRVRQAQQNGMTYPLVDPDPGNCYTRAKKAKCPVCSATTATPLQALSQRQDVNFVQDMSCDEFSSSTRHIPKRFSYLKMLEHVKKTGKRTTAGVFVEKTLEKGYKFFVENYVHNVKSAGNSSLCFIKCYCYRSQRKNEQPHVIQVTLAKSDGTVNKAFCSCVAGLCGHCNHIMGLLYLVDHSVKLNLKDFPIAGTCTDNPQQWHKPRTDGVKAEPIMGYTVKKPKYSEKVSQGFSSTLYEARTSTVQNTNGLLELQQSLRQSDPTVPFCNLDLMQTEPSKTRMGFSVAKGSFLSYHLAITPANCEVLTNFPNVTEQYIGLGFPSLPYRQYEVCDLSRPLTEECDSFYKQLQIDRMNTIQLEKDTLGQSDNPAWFKGRKYRLTASRFGLVFKRKDLADQTKFVQETLILPKDLSRVPAINYGITNESRVVTKYLEFMANSGTPVNCFECGLVVNPAMPWAGVSPDRKLIDLASGPGLLEVKCSYSFKNVPIKMACSSPGFPCELVNGKPQLKRNHNYYYQVQGQLGVCGLKWCDFVIFTEKGFVVERIMFNPFVWKELINTLCKFYQKHYIPAAISLIKNNPLK